MAAMTNPKIRITASMLRRFVPAAALLALAACADGPAIDEPGLSGASPANFHYKSDAAHAAALRQAMESGQPARWASQSWTEADKSGVITPAAAFTDSAGRPCRPLTITRDATTRNATACQGADGTWIVAEWMPERGQ